jgi:hypothetical protein
VFCMVLTITSYCFSTQHYLVGLSCGDVIYVSCEIRNDFIYIIYKEFSLCRVHLEVFCV